MDDSVAAAANPATTEELVISRDVKDAAPYDVLSSPRISPGELKTIGSRHIVILRLTAL